MMTFDQSRAYIEQGRRLRRLKKRTAILTILGSSLAMWVGLLAIGWGVWGHLP